MAKTALPVPSKVFLFGTATPVAPGGFCFRPGSLSEPDAASLILNGRDGSPPVLVSFPISLDDFRDLGLHCLHYARARSDDSVFLSFPHRVEFSGDLVRSCSGFIFVQKDDVPHLTVLRLPSETKGRVEPLVQIPLTYQQIHDLGIAAIVFAETR
jgi:hypothetical protein